MASLEFNRERSLRRISSLKYLTKCSSVCASPDLSRSRYGASNAKNSKPRSSEATGHAPKFTLLGGSSSKYWVAVAGSVLLPARNLRSGLTVTRRQRAGSVDLIRRLPEPEYRLVVPFQKSHHALGQRCCAI